MSSTNTTSNVANCNDAIRLLLPPLHCPNDTEQLQNPTKPFPIRGERAINDVNVPHVIAMVGLPARGKTFISKKLSRYLNWIGISTRVFNLDNEEAMTIRNKCAHQALDDACQWLLSESGGSVAVFDATNSTIERRQLIHDIVVNRHKLKLFFIESICDDPKIVDQNIKEVKVSSPDYVNMNTDLVLNDFLKRIEHYQERYQTLDEVQESYLSFIKIYNTGTKVVVFNNEGHLQARIVYYLMNIHITPRTIYLTRHGESEHNLKGLIGGDSDLSNRGKLFAKSLSNFINEEQILGLRVWTSCMKRAIQTVDDIDAPKENWRALNEIDAGICEEMKYTKLKLNIRKNLKLEMRINSHTDIQGARAMRT
uniref:6-phosphofructo-2-kinase domain-containing protein n=1 Tax=Megaselia scalaris TaxID=36166 RepID=T1GLZ5_MEGSC